MNFYLPRSWECSKQFHSPLWSKIKWQASPASISLHVEKTPHKWLSFNTSTTKNIASTRKEFLIALWIVFFYMRRAPRQAHCHLKEKSPKLIFLAFFLKVKDDIGQIKAMKKDDNNIPIEILQSGGSTKWVRRPYHYLSKLKRYCFWRTAHGNQSNNNQKGSGHKLVNKNTVSEDLDSRKSKQKKKVMGRNIARLCGTYTQES